MTDTFPAAEAGPDLARPLAPPTSVQPTPDGGAKLRRQDLHGSVSDPLLDTMTFLNEITERYPDAISFAPGRPHEGFFETEQIFDHLRRYLDHLAEGGATPEQVRAMLFQYGSTAGQIQKPISDWLRAVERIDVPTESIVVTVGAQEAMLLAARALIAGPEDVLFVSSPCYVGMTGAARLLDIRPVAVAEGEHGFRCVDLERAITAERARGRRPRAFYVVPDHSNPSGTTMPLATRRELLALAAHQDILIIEDSPYRLVSQGQQLPSLKSLDRDRRVVHLGSFAKTLFPGARVGFVIADQPVVDATGRTELLAANLAKIKSMVTLNTSPLSQAVVAGMLLAAGEGTSALNTEMTEYYGNAMRTTLTSLRKSLPEEIGVRWNEPRGGFFVSLTVPFRANNAALVRSAEDFGVIWTPMSYFYPEGGGDNGVRLSVSYLPEPKIIEGIERLAGFVRAMLTT